MSKSALHAFIDRARADEDFRSKLAHLDPNQIIEFAGQHGFMFSDEIKGRFINRWSGVYSVSYTHLTLPTILRV